jgi:hypothetical protein
MAHAEKPVASGRTPVEIVMTLSSPSPAVAVYTVPPGKQLTITDVIIAAGSGGTASIYRNGTGVSRVTLGGTATSTYEHSYVSGIVFEETQIVSIDNLGGGSGGSVHYELRGFLE